ncbi:hypothetical protein [Acinetobacter lwoffii]|uniref:hypothetical protein n=1 Tax=Acinetobacter lwoffii TaxID=28090 RepID=UPI001E5E29F5|nr:hypothetical protein [Acinetobacter lwoffii]
MANINGRKQWSSVRLLETHELARGGVNGNLNEQAQALADRTEFLNQEKASKSEIVQGIYEFDTYALFDAAKATLPSNCTVVISQENTTGSGTWGIGNNSWNGSILKKSAFDPVEKSLIRTKKIFEQENFFKILANKTAKSRVKEEMYSALSVASSTQTGIALTVSSVSNPSEIIVGVEPLRFINPILKNISQSISKFVVSRPAGVILDYDLMPEDQVENSSLTTKWGDFDVSNISLINPTVMTDTNGYRVKFIVNSTAANGFNDGNALKNVVEMTSTVATMPATEMSAYDGLAISFQGESSNKILQVKVSNSFLSGNGYALTPDDAKLFATQLIPVLNLKFRLSTPKVIRTGVLSSLFFTQGTTSLAYGNGVTLTASLAKQVQTLNSVVTLRDELTKRVNQYDIDSSFANFQRLQDVSNVGENSNTLNSSGSIELSSDRVIYAFSASIANNAVGEIILKSNKHQFKIPVRGGDVFSGPKLTTSWKDYSFDASKITASNVIRANDYLRIQLALNDLPAQSSGISNANIVDVSGLFASASQQNIEATSGLAISSHNAQSLQMKITLSYLSSLGYDGSIDSEVLRFVTDICTVMKLKVRTYSNFETLNPAHLLNLPAGGYTVEATTGVSFSLELRDIKTVSNEIKDKGFETFSTSVKNNSSYAIENGFVALKVAFPQSLVSSDSQIVVKDLDGNILLSQYAPDRNPNEPYRVCRRLFYLS